MQEDAPAVSMHRLGYIHPYTDENGRMGRFLMNVMLGAGGYPWTVVPVEMRGAYMAALEDASVRQDIIPFAEIPGELPKGGNRRQATCQIVEVIVR